MRVHPLRSVLFALAAAVPGCTSSDASGSDRATVRDSAGITIVETTRAAWTDSAAAWTIDPSPRLDIGIVDGALPYLLDRVVGATRLPDGRIVIANGGTNELRFFDSAGVHLQSVGGTGEGPGEFEYVRALSRCGADSLFAHDLNWQVKLFTADGEFVRQQLLQEPGSPRTPYQLACSPRGGFVISGWGMGDGPPQPGFSRAMTTVWLLDATGDSIGTIGAHLASERLTSSTGSRPHPFGRTTVFAFGAEEVYLGDGSRFEVKRHARDGRLVGIQRAPPEDLSITEDLLNAYREDVLSRVSESLRPAFEREFREMPLTDGVPAFTAIRLDPAEHVWVRRFTIPGETRETWGVFAPDGIFLGHLTMPPRFTLLEIGSDYVLGLSRDEDGVQRVQLHALDRRGERRS